MVLRSRASKQSKSTKPTSATCEPVPVILPLRRRLLRPNESLSNEEALISAHWLRQILALTLGICCGFAQLTGVFIILLFVILAFMGVTSLLTSIHELDLDEIAKTAPLQTEGLLPAFALFMLSWIIAYTVRLP